MTTDGDFDPDRPRPPRPLENIVNLDPAATFLLQLPHEVPSSLSLASTPREDANREGGQESPSERSATVGDDRKTGSALIQHVAAREQTQGETACYPPHDEQVRAISRTGAEAEKLFPCLTM